MSVNSSSLSSSALDSVFLNCTNSTVSVLIGTTFSVTRAFLLIPLSIIVLYLCHQQWRQQRSFATTSHSDIFTYNMAASELICCLGFVIYFWGSSSEVISAGFCLTAKTLFGEGFFHVLTCVERYLAVVHPITYMGLRNERGVRIRNISIGCVWLVGLGWSIFVILQDGTLSRITFFCILAPCVIVVSFCSLSVLCVLIRPGPGEGGRDKKRVDQSKQRAFHTVMAITVVLWLWFIGFLVSFALDTSPLLGPDVGCVVKISAFWFNLPCSVISPLLYLHRAGKLSCCCHSSGDG